MPKPLKSQNTAQPDENEDFHSADEISRHPDFDAACDLFVDEMLNLYGNDKRLIRGLVEVVRAISFMLIVSLDAGYKPDDPSTYPTFAHLRAALQQMGITNHRRVLDIVNGMQQDGFLTREPATHDRRVHILRPTEKMLASDRDWLAAHHASLAFLYPDERAYQMAVKREPAYQTGYRRASLKSFAIGNDILGSNPAIGYFLGQEVGYRILMVLMQAVRSNRTHRTPAGFYTAAAARSGVSRNHVRNVLKGAAALGLVALSDPPGLYVEVLEPLRESVRNWIAMSLAGTSQVGKRGMALLDQPAERH